MHWTLIPTPDGLFRAGFSSNGLCRLLFPGQEVPEEPPSIEAEEGDLDWEALTSDALRAQLDGREPGELPPLDWCGGTDFQKRVWQALQEIPAGETRSYGDLALKLGVEGGARAVGTACGANPIPVLVPCHRVLAADQGLGGFSGGLDWKKRLLEREGAGYRDTTVRS